MKLTRQMIHDAATPRGAWNSHQLALIGVQWPPKQGWLSELVGTEIEPEKYAEFVRFGKMSAKTRRQEKGVNVPQGRLF